MLIATWGEGLMAVLAGSRRRELKARDIAVASMIGTAIEWYDFYVYGTSVVLVLGPLFFPTADPLTSMLLAFSTFGVGFLARPLGAIALSHLGDRVSRKSALVFSLLLMGGATVGVGLLPTYQAIGVWAPILLVVLRCAQGFAVGGEWGGAVLLAVEHAPSGQRNRYGSYPQYGTPIGLMGSATVILLAQLLPDAAWDSWGWRLPFLASLPLFAVGMWIRLRVTDAEEFQQVRRAKATLDRPVAEVLRRHWRTVLLGTAVTIVCHAAYIVTTFLPSYSAAMFGTTPKAGLLGMIAGSLVAIGVLLVVAGRADASDRRRYVVAGAVLSGLWIFPAFRLAGELGDLGLILGMTAGLGVLMLQYAVLPGLLADLFPVVIRYSGVSLCFQLSAVVGGALLPLLASWSVRAVGGHYWPAAALMAAAAVLTTWGARRIKTGPPDPAACP